MFDVTSIVFAQPAWLWLLALVPVWGAWIWFRQGRKGLRYSTIGAAKPIESTIWTRVRGLPAVLQGMALVLLILALARPQVHDVRTTQTTDGISIMLVLDISSSMRATDFPPNRLEVARDVAAEFVESRPTDQIGLMVFAGKAYTQVPPTLDHDFLQEMLRRIDIGLVEDGTAIGTALASAVNRLRDADAESRVVVLLTDGENNRGEIDPYTAAGVAQAKNVRVYTVGVSPFDTEFASNPLARSAAQQEGPGSIDEAMLQAVAERTGGAYFHAADPVGLRDVYQAISELETTDIEMDTYTEVDERYRSFLWPALVLLFIAVALGNTRLRRFPSPGW